VSYSVGEIARLACVTVRTLHHYDEIDLLKPSSRTAAGYRNYSDADVDRLQKILFFRELDLPLDTIATILDSPNASPSDHLAQQRRLLVERIERLESLVAAIDRTLEAQRMGYELSPQEKLEIFGQWQPPPAYFEELAALRSAPSAFGSTETWVIPESKEGWQAIEDRRRSFAERIADAMEAGLAPTSAEAMALIEEERGRKSHRQQVMIADWYASKPEYFGFIARPNEQLPGMPDWYRDAVRANAERAG
jgi:MerR family transcriptional regulator, thiopeptide resistance regulator